MIPLFAVHMPKTVDESLLETLHGGYIGQGIRVEEFETLLGQRFDNQNVLTLNSATSGIHLALRLAEVEGGEVITTPMTCTATNMPILANGAKIVWADVDPLTGLIDPLDVERKITENTRAVISVDWGGTPCDYDELMRIGQQYGIKVIEDAAHAIGATYKGRKSGTLADFTVFSFQAIKHISTVDGGALFVKDPDLYKRGKLLRWYGIDRETDRKDFRCEDDIIDWGYKFHMNDVAATIGIEQLNHLDRIIGSHQLNAYEYDQNLDFDYYQIPVPVYDYQGAYWLYTILLPDVDHRLDFMQEMKDKEVMVSQVHARNDLHTVFAPYKQRLPGVDKFYGRQVSIPVHWNLLNEDMNHIIKTMNHFAERGKTLSNNRVWL